MGNSLESTLLVWGQSSGNWDLSCGSPPGPGLCVLRLCRVLTWSSRCGQWGRPLRGVSQGSLVSWAALCTQRGLQACGSDGGQHHPGSTLGSRLLSSGPLLLSKPYPPWASVCPVLAVPGASAHPREPPGPALIPAGASLG